MNGKINLKKLSCIIVILYLMLGIMFYFIGGEQLRVGTGDGSFAYNSADKPVDTILKNVTIEQEFSVSDDIINSITIRPGTYGKVNKGNLFVKIIDKDSNDIIFNQTIDLSILKDNSDFALDIKNKINGIKGKVLCLNITSDSQDINNAITLWSGKAIDGKPLYINGKLSDSTLTFSVKSLKVLWFGTYYWYILFGSLGLIIIYLINLIIKQKSGRKSLGINVLNAFVKYKFLLNQLIKRDFKTKYKRSVLGVLWSFLNPLLTMIVQYIVFSTIFKSDIPNFPVYLLTGIVIFNFFTEACGMGLMSIVGNASLITKVYMPKYIYPVSRVFSSVINLLLSLIPLAFVTLLTGTNIKPVVLLVPFGLICTLLFSIGITFILCTAMVFFRDTQFIWNVVSLLWTYATPLFYPENIIPEKFNFILKFNPMYHFVRFVRICILEGVSPEPKAYLYCIAFSLGTFLIGTIIFKKNQDKFVLNI